MVTVYIQLYDLHVKNQLHVSAIYNFIPLRFLVFNVHGTVHR